MKNSPSEFQPELPYPLQRLKSRMPVLSLQILFVLRLLFYILPSNCLRNYPIEEETLKKCRSLDDEKLLQQGKGDKRQLSAYFDSCDCGRESTDRAPGSLAYRIVSTEFVRPLHRYPWMVQIRVAGEQWGGGVIITPSYILTAAHVAKQIQVAASYSEDNEISLKDASVAIATQSKNKEFVSFRIHQIKLHPGFKSAGEHPIFDIALLKLKDVLIFSERLRPICLTRNLDLEKAGVHALIIGWGKMTKGKQPREIFALLSRQHYSLLQAKAVSTIFRRRLTSFALSCEIFVLLLSRQHLQYFFLF
ncbi:uncharacterized protein CDAR_482731 [Caerostris darwini]|uniref:Peptidase S1 domain-containing protein n=1 Tax=Caerostris darwini TaxID=1538125 RepID=A0AAV4WCM7_9ARAC|nr:uncharacterized protein CDAR_482731 [Caerostris darwini]